MKFTSDQIQKQKAKIITESKSLIDRKEVSILFRGEEMKLVHGVDPNRYRPVDGKRRAYRGYMFRNGVFASIGVGGATVYHDTGQVESIHFRSNFDGIAVMINEYNSLDDTLEEEQSFWHQHNL